MTKLLIDNRFGNPAMVYGATQAAPVVIKEGFSLVKTGLTILLVGGAVLLTLKAYKKAIKSKWINRASSDNNVNAALKIWQSIPDADKISAGSLFNPFGFVTDLVNKVKSIWQSTDTDKILYIAKYDITELKTTCEAFKGIYDVDLMFLLSNILDKTSYDLFIKYCSQEKKDNQVVNDPTQTGKIVITNKETTGYIVDKNFWKMPVMERATKGIKQMRNRIPANAYVGTIINGTSFQTKDKRTGKAIKYYAIQFKSGNQTNIISLPDTDIRIVEASSVDIKKYLKPIALGSIPAYKVKAIRNASVYIDGKVVGTVKGNHIIGDFVSQEQDENGNLFIVFRPENESIEVMIRKEFVEIKKAA